MVKIGGNTILGAKGRKMLAFSNLTTGLSTSFAPLVQITTKVALVLLGGAITLLVIPFKYLLAFGLLDLFTRELEFRREMVMKFNTFLKESWASVHAAPVVVLPYVNETEPGRTLPKQKVDEPAPKSIQRNGSSKS